MLPANARSPCAEFSELEDHLTRNGPEPKSTSSPTDRARSQGDSGTAARQETTFPSPSAASSVAPSAGDLPGLSDVRGAHPGVRPTPPSPRGTVTLGMYVDLAPGVSSQGTNDRAWIAWHCENRNGCFFPELVSGELSGQQCALQWLHCSALSSFVLTKSTMTFARAHSFEMGRGRKTQTLAPSTGCGGSNAKEAGVSSVPAASAAADRRRNGCRRHFEHPGVEPCLGNASRRCGSCGSRPEGNQ